MINSLLETNNALTPTGATDAGEANHFMNGDGKRHIMDSDIHMMAVGGYLDVSTSSITGSALKGKNSQHFGVEDGGRQKREMTNEQIDGDNSGHFIRSQYQEKLALFDQE